jgi:hypothetical protein
LTLLIMKMPVAKNNFQPKAQIQDGGQNGRQNR